MEKEETKAVHEMRDELVKSFRIICGRIDDGEKRWKPTPAFGYFWWHVDPPPPHPSECNIQTKAVNKIKFGCFDLRITDCNENGDKPLG